MVQRRSCNPAATGSRARPGVRALWAALKGFFRPLWLQPLPPPLKELHLRLPGLTDSPGSGTDGDDGPVLKCRFSCHLGPEPPLPTLVEASIPEPLASISALRHEIRHGLCPWRQPLIGRAGRPRQPCTRCSSRSTKASRGPGRIFSSAAQLVMPRHAAGGIRAEPDRGSMGSGSSAS